VTAAANPAARRSAVLPKGRHRVLGGTGAALALAALLAACAPGTRARSRAPLDFSDRGNWAALPGMQSTADQTPVPVLKNRQAEAVADVFFVHPTTYLSIFGWNATTDDERLNRLTAKGPIRLQASAFNGCCRIFAPRYRQAGLKSFMSRSPKGHEALQLAYADVLDAFRYFLDHFNEGRPFIIAAHSQGSRHAERLLAEVVDVDPGLRRRLVAAYLVGWPVACNAFRHIPPCDRPDQTGCFVTWRTYTWGSSKARGHWDRGGCCINPLSWRHDGTYAPKTLNRGGTPYTFDRLDPDLTDAQCVNGKLWVHEPDKGGYISLGRNLHLMDYNLFYENIRENAETRLDAFLEQERAAAKTSPQPARPSGSPARARPGATR